MDRRDIERRANEILAKHAKSRLPVPIEEIATAEGALIARNHFAGSESGFALRDGDRWVIGVNTKTSPRRQRFSIAHGLGHLLLHDERPLIVDHSVFVDDRIDKRGSSLGTDEEEIEANGFAVAILMPRDAIIIELREELEAGHASSRDELIARLARAFEVSTEAMGFRLINLNIMSA